jgi:hypothetical protein
MLVYFLDLILIWHVAYFRDIKQKAAESGLGLNFNANRRTTGPTEIVCRIYIEHTTRMKVSELYPEKISKDDSDLMS